MSRGAGDVVVVLFFATTFACVCVFYRARQQTTTLRPSTREAPDCRVLLGGVSVGVFCRDDDDAERGEGRRGGRGPTGRCLPRLAARLIEFFRLAKHKKRKSRNGLVAVPREREWEKLNEQWKKVFTFV